MATSSFSYSRSGFLLSNCNMFLSSAALPIYLLLLSHILVINSEPTQDRQALEAFHSATPHANRLIWNASASACDWYGVTCDRSRSYVYYLRLPATGLIGAIPPDTIGRLSQLRVLSLHSNALSGQIPPDFKNLTSLRSLYLHNNLFSGEFPTSLTELIRLNRLDLSNNNFSGSIPLGLNNLTHLTGLFLQNNNFSGTLPNIDVSLDEFSVSNNSLNGSIPKSLSRFPESSFAGNLQLCGKPLSPCNGSLLIPPAASPSDSVVPSTPAKMGSHKKLSKSAIAAIVVSSVVVFLILLILLFYCCRKRRDDHQPKTPKSTAAVGATGGRAIPVMEPGTSSSKDDLTSGAAEGERNKLVFVDSSGGVAGSYSFDLEDLLRASAEVLGKGSVGTSYKAVLEEGTTVVVKRLKDVTASKREFELQMEMLGECRHENVVPLRAYYYSKDEKLLVYDFLPAGSLSALLHGSRGSGKTPLDWESRMKIAICTARGLSHLHGTNNVVHGNLKSSNILLRQPDNEAGVSDYGLNPLFSNASPAKRMAGYRAPEVYEARKVTFKSDVYSFGVLLLELLTGKSPNQASLGEEGIDLPRWVQSVVREEWTAEVFDVELMRFNNIEEEMVQLLQIAMSCVQTVPDQRPPMPQVLRMIEEMNRGETDDGLRQSSDDPSKGSGGQTPQIGSRTPPSSVTP